MSAEVGKSQQGFAKTANPRVKLEPVLELSPRSLELQKVIGGYRQVGQRLTKLSYSRVRGPGGIEEDTEQLIHNERKIRRKYPHQAGKLTAGQLASINNRERGILRQYDPEYSKLLQRELDSRRSRAMALKRIIFSSHKKKSPSAAAVSAPSEFSESSTATNSTTTTASSNITRGSPAEILSKSNITGDKAGHNSELAENLKDKKKLYNARPSLEDRLDTLRSDIEVALMQSATSLAQKKEKNSTDTNASAPSSPAAKLHSPQILVLKSRIKALNSSINGESFAVKGGIANLSVAPLNFTMAVRHLLRYIDQLKLAKISIAHQNSAIESDIEFERKLIAELKLISSTHTSRSIKKLTKKKEDGDDDAATIGSTWISQYVGKKKVNADDECSRLMGCLSYLIKVHLAPYLCLFSHHVPAFSNPSIGLKGGGGGGAGSLSKKAKKENSMTVVSDGGTSKFSISNQLQAAQNRSELLDANMVSARLQQLLKSLLNQSIVGADKKSFGVQIKSTNDPIARLLIECEVVVIVSRAPYIIRLCDFGKTLDDIDQQHLSAT